MKRRTIIGLGSRVSLALFLFQNILLGGEPLTAAGSTNRPPPNLLILVADDLGWADVSYHKGTIPTPRLDRLATEGVELQRFYAYPVCSPTRAALLTGQVPRRFGVADVILPMQNLPDGLVTLPGTLRSAGYRTSLVGKWHLGLASTPQKNGFDHFYGFLGAQLDYYKHTNQRDETDWQRDGTTLQEEGYSTFLIANEAVRQLEKHDPSRPFFLQVCFNAPHFPLSAPAELLKKYSDRSSSLATYAAVVDALDASIGRILDALEKQGLRENTLVVFFSDNGAGRQDGGSNRPLRLGKGTLYEGGIRTLCLMRWPGHLKAQTVSQQPLAVQDLFPTLLAAAGVSKKEELKLDGQNLWAALSDGQVKARPPLLIATTDYAVIDGDWKYMKSADGQQSLYQLAKDPEETTDVQGAFPEVAQRLDTWLSAEQKDFPAVRARPRPGPGMGRPGMGGQGRPGMAGSGRPGNRMP